MTAIALYQKPQRASEKRGQYVIEPPKARRILKWHDATILSTNNHYKLARDYFKQRVAGIPRHVQGRLLKEYAKRYNSETALNPIGSANIYLRKATELLREIIAAAPFQNIKALKRDHVLEDEARQAVDACNLRLHTVAGEWGEYSHKIKAAYDALAEYTHTRGVNPPPAKEDETEAQESAILRMVDDGWWLLKLRRQRDQINEFINIAAGIVKKDQQPYVSNQALQAWKQARNANQLYLESMEVVNEDTQETIDLAQIAAASTANPEKRRIELMVRCRGLEELADDLGYAGHFVTLTAPGSWHRVSKTWNKANPKDTQAYLCGQWAKCRAALDRHGIRWFGVRVVEPHGDSTPHWHMLVFCHPKDAEDVKATLRGYALEHDAEEKGAQANRFDWEFIDPDKGSATGYIAKYIAKNINGAHTDGDSDHSAQGNLKDNADRVAAWASVWRIRQFQFFGAAPVTIWRECRRLKSSAEHEALEKIRAAADSSRWAEFTKLLRDNPVKIQYNAERRNRFNEVVKEVVGLTGNGFEQLTRLVKFSIRKKGRAEALSGDSRATWSTVNNCTELADRLKSEAQIIGLPPQAVDILVRGSRYRIDNRVFQIRSGQLIEFEA